MRHLPNIITFSRIGVLVALIWLVFEPWTGAATLAFFCILYGSVSDFLDGYIARKYGFITNFGKIMDALVDKCMTLGSFALLLYVGLLQPVAWMLPVVVLMAVREIGITVMRMIAARKDIILEADKGGKRKTIWQVTSICVLFAVPMFTVDLARLLQTDLSLFGNYIWLNGYLYFALAAWLTLSSGYSYSRKYLPIVLGSGGAAEGGK
jgi:CDP-diacylglycerol--glycerol-3-phosphate 3-phosphatidyltransferase